MRKFLAGGALAVALGLGAVHPASAQTTTTEPVTTVQTDDNSGSGKWGLLGLAGLLGLGGLAGLKRRDRDDVTARDRDDVHLRKNVGATRVPQP
jgi:MYXO-CTERM domain-containing protein